METSKQGGAQQKAELSLFGMHCASCANIIERRLRKVSGVRQASVNFGTEKATIFFDTAETDIAALKAAVKEAGYTAQEIDASDTEFEKKKRERTEREYRQKFFRGLSLSIPMFYFMLFDFFDVVGRESLLPFVGIISLLIKESLEQFILMLRKHILTPLHSAKTLVAQCLW
jgi:Cu+-exporting ATPase